MSDTTPSGSSFASCSSDGSRAPSPLSPTDAADAAALVASLSTVLPAVAPMAAPAAPSDGSRGDKSGKRGTILLNASTLRRLREAKLLSQQELADTLYLKRIQVSIATIKRAETGRAVRFRIARDLALFFGVACDDLLR
jgi:hypothetical protein